MTAKRRILANGSGMYPSLVRYFAKLTDKDNPKICFLPTATGDDKRWIKVWHDLGEKMGFDSYDQLMFISSFEQKKTFKEVLLNMDAIYVGGGNTVNMLAVWEAMWVTPILRQAYEQGILMGGGSAGGICWFENGLTDSRPIELTAMDALGWLKGSFSPHYLSEPGRREYCHKYLLNGELSDGYGVDDCIGLLFEDEELVKAVGSTDPESRKEARGFKVSKVDDRIIEVPLEIEWLNNESA